MNTQPAEKPDFKPNGDLRVHSVFATIQGEGPFAGVPATFVRLAGCNLQCPGCDTSYTAGAVNVSEYDLANKVEATPKPFRSGHLVVITGGEPFRQNIGPFARRLLTLGYRIQIETNGTLYVPGPWTAYGVSIVCSPKTPKINEELRPLISAYKYVVRAGELASDGLPTRTLLGRGVGQTGPTLARPLPGYGGPVYVQPLDEQEYDRNLRNRSAAIHSCLCHGYTLCLQLHKILGME